MPTSTYDFSGNASDWRDNKSYGEGGLSASTDRSTWSLHRKRQEGNKRLAQQRDRANQIQDQMATQKRDASYRTNALMSGELESGYNQAFNRLNKYEGQMDEGFARQRAENARLYGDARSRYGLNQDGTTRENSMLGFGQLGGNYLMQNAFDPNAYQKHLVGERARDAITKRADRAYQDNLVAANSRRGISTMDLAGARRAQSDVWRQDQMEAERLEMLKQAQATQMRGWGNDAARGLAGIDLDARTSGQNLTTNELNMRGAHNTNYANTLLGRTSGRMGLQGARDQALQSYWNGKMGRADTAYNAWEGREDRDLVWGTGEMLADRRIDEQAKRDEQDQWMAGLGKALEVGGGLLTGPAGSLASTFGKSLLG